MDHILPAKGKVVSARFFAEIFGEAEFDAIFGRVWFRAPRRSQPGAVRTP